MKKAFRVLNNIEEYILMFLLAVMGLTIAAQVFFRFVLNSPLVFTEEIASFCFIWITFIGSSYCVKHGLHTRVDAFTNLLPKSMQKGLSILSDLFCIGILFYLFPIAWKFNIQQLRIPSTALQVPLSVIYTAVVISIVLTSLRLGVNIYKTLTGQKITVGVTEL